MFTACIIVLFPFQEQNDPMTYCNSGTTASNRGLGPNLFDLGELTSKQLSCSANKDTSSAISYVRILGDSSQAVKFLP